jgi:hypothetical protein
MTHRRRYSRLPFRTASTLAVGEGGTVHRTELIDLSLKGALLQRPATLRAEAGAEAVLTVRLADSDVTIRMQGTLAHVSGERLGLHCQSIDMDSMIHLRRLMELNLGDPGLLERELLALG